MKYPMWFYGLKLLIWLMRRSKMGPVSAIFLTASVAFGQVPDQFKTVVPIKIAQTTAGLELTYDLGRADFAAVDVRDGSVVVTFDGRPASGTPWFEGAGLHPILGVQIDNGHRKSVRMVVTRASLSVDMGLKVGYRVYSDDVRNSNGCLAAVEELKLPGIRSLRPTDGGVVLTVDDRFTQHVLANETAARFGRFVIFEVYREQ